MAAPNESVTGKRNRLQVGEWSDDVAMGAPTDWQTPRRYEAGFRVEF